MANVGNPFSWDFKEERSFETIAQRGKATYSKPLDTINNKTSRDSFFSEVFGVSPNRAFITGFTPFEPIPFLPLSSGKSADNKDNCCDEKPIDNKTHEVGKETTDKTPSESEKNNKENKVTEKENSDASTSTDGKSSNTEKDTSENGGTLTPPNSKPADTHENSVNTTPTNNETTESHVEPNVSKPEKEAKENNGDITPTNEETVESNGATIFSGGGKVSSDDHL